MFFLILIQKTLSNPKPTFSYIFFEDFSQKKSHHYWKNTKVPEYSPEWTFEQTIQPQSCANETALVLKKRGVKYGISRSFSPPLKTFNKTLIFQYEVRIQYSFTSSGIYFKLFSDPFFNSSVLDNITPYFVMFGGDKNSEKPFVHLIYQEDILDHGISRRQEHRMKQNPIFNHDYINHLFTLILRPNTTFEILIDNKLRRRGNLSKSFLPPVEPPFIFQPKPADWDDREVIPDEISRNTGPVFYQTYHWNPNYKGKWIPKLIPNPKFNFSIPNITGIGLEIWATNNQIAFTNILISDNEETVKEWNEKTFIPRQSKQIDWIEREITKKRIESNL